VRRLFLGLYVRVMLAIAVAAVVVRAVVIPRVEHQVSLNIANTLSPPLAVMAGIFEDEHRRGGDLDALLARFSSRFDAPLSLVPRGSVAGVAPSSLSELDRGRAVATEDYLRAVVYMRLEGTDRVLAVGPLNPVHPLGQGRGLTLLLLLVAGLTAGVFIIARPLERRLTSLSRAAMALGGGDLDVRAETGPPDAVGHLERTFNVMATEIRRLIEAHRELLRMVSHELRTPIQRLHLALQMANDTEHGDVREKHLARMATDLDELDALIEELLAYSRVEERIAAARETVDARALLDEAALGDGTGVSVAVRDVPGEPIALRAEPRLLRRALANLVRNARQHARTRVELGARAEGGAVIIEVDDDGPGVAAEQRERIFEPFYRIERPAEEGRRGLGLGLAIVRRIAEGHGGRVEVSTSDLGGARFRLALPVPAVVPRSG
jgi:signal transduction histidine kinase